MKKQRILLVGIISVGVIALLILFGWLFRKPLYRLSLGDIDARYRSAMLAYQEHRYADARKELAPLARLDTAKCAQFLLGDLLYRGEGGPADLPEALNLFLMAARQEHVDAQANAGFMYTYGLGTRQDFGEAMDWLYRAALRGNPKAQLGMGNLYKNGWGPVRNEQAALNWYRRAAAHGNSDAMNNIGYMYRNGLGVPRNYEEALFWFQKAANLGNSSAQYNIGNLYCWGKGHQLQHNLH